MTSAADILRRSLAAVLVAGILPVFGGATLCAQKATVTAHDAWVREAPAGRTVTAVFVVVENTGKAARSIVSGVTTVADTLELHEMKMVGTSMQMSPVTSIALPAGGKAELKPGGLHIMLFGLKKPLSAGDKVQLTLTLDDGTKVPVTADVRKMGGM
jgi:copper(I)-binding protein